MASRSTARWCFWQRSVWMSAVFRHPPRHGSRLGPRFLAHLVHGADDFIHAVLEEVADEQVRQLALELGIAADEAAEAEAVIVFAHQPPHAFHAARERITPL